MGKYENYTEDYFANRRMFWYESYINENIINEPTKSIFQLSQIFGLKGKNILEIGFGKGILASLLINGGANYYGIDISESALNELQSTLSIKCASEPYTAKVGNLIDIDQLFPKTQFDLVIFQSTLEHIYLDDIEIFFNNILFQLNSYAKIIIGNAQYPTGLHLPGNKNVGAHVTNINDKFIEILTEELKTYFNLILHIKGYFVLERNENFRFLKPVSLKDNNGIEHIRIINKRYSLHNQSNFFLKRHIFRRPLQLLKRLLELERYA
jgi:hypothetical protein